MCGTASPGILDPMFTPLEFPGPHGGHGDGAFFFPWVGLSMFFLLLVLAAALALHLWRSGRLQDLARGFRPGPEQDAKRVLAERFAQGDLSSEEFMERASVLNWTPGSESYPARGRKRVGG